MGGSPIIFLHFTVFSLQLSLLCLVPYALYLIFPFAPSRLCGLNYPIIQRAALRILLSKRLPMIAISCALRLRL